jgi:hypothetical protein
LKDIASRCLAFSAIIKSTLWIDFIEDNETNNFELFIQLTNSIIDRIYKLMMFTQKSSLFVFNKAQYAGYDERDKKDYNIKDCNENILEDAEQKKVIKNANENLTIKFLILNQLYCRQIVFIQKVYEDKNSAKKNNKFSSFKIKNLFEEFILYLIGFFFFFIYFF